MKLHRILLPLLLLLLKGGTAAVEPGAQVPPDPQFQARIAAVVNAMVRKKEAVQERLEQLDEIAKARREKLLQQLALYLSRSGGTEESMGGALLLRHFQFTPDEKLEAVLPCLESRDPLLRKVAEEILGTVDRPHGGPPDFTLYEARIRIEGASDQAALIRYMFGVSPDAALASMTRLYAVSSRLEPAAADAVKTLKELISTHPGIQTWAASDRRRGQAMLDRLSRHPAWWVRLYAAAVLVQHPVLTTPEILTRLKEDHDPSVARFVQR